MHVFSGKGDNVELTVYQQTMTFLWSFVMGTAITLMYIAVTVIREISPPNRVQLIIGDILFSGAAITANFFFALSQTEGNIRFYTVMAETVSFFVLYFTFGKLLKKLTRIIYDFIVRVIHIICSPVRKIVFRISAVRLTKDKFMLKKVKKIKN